MFTHCDMTQALGNLKIDMSKYENIDMATVSGHKIHGPKGIGFCYINGKYLYMVFKQKRRLNYGRQRNYHNT